MDNSWPERVSDRAAARTRHLDAKEHLLATPGADLSAMRKIVARSWFRSYAAGVNPHERGTVMQPGHVDAATVEFAESHLSALDAFVGDFGGFIGVAAPNGALTHLDYLRARSEFPAGISLLEEHCGSNGVGLALEEGRGVWLAPEEHYKEDMPAEWCFASLVRDPFHRRTRAVLSMTLPAERAKSIEPISAMLMLETTAARIEQELEKQASTRERGVLKEYIALTRRRGGCAVLSFDGRNTMMNALAASMVGDTDLPLVMSYAKQAMSTLSEVRVTVNLQSVGSVELEAVPVELPLAEAGVLVVIPPPRLRDVRVVPGSIREANNNNGPSSSIDGSGGMNDHLVHRFDLISAQFQHLLDLAKGGMRDRRSFAIVGEPGTGKRRLAGAIGQHYDSSFTYDCRNRANHEDNFVTALRDADIGENSAVVLEHAESLRSQDAQAVIELTQGLVGVSVVMTFARPTVTTLALSEALAVLELSVPPLRERREDIAVLARAFAREMGTCVLSRRLLAVLTDANWEGNAGQLRAVVSQTVERCQGPQATIDDLPKGFQRALTLGRLSRLEDAEYSEIRHALNESRQNRTRAAEMLQIARSTLYRRMDYFRSRGFEF